VAGPAGFYYADVPNRSIAMVIDVIAMVVVFFVIGVITIALFGVDAGPFGRFPTVTSLLAQAILSYAVWAVYFIYTWVNMRGTLGMKLLGMQVGHEADGRTLTYNQAAIRFGVLFGPVILIGLLSALVPSLAILGWLSFLWLIVLLVTMAQSPTKQGLHDRYAQTMVVKAARALG
jgi:uncharacterized RDD family membrane protein YckC